MARTLLPNVEDLGELLEQLGGVAPNRVRLHPQPGTATEKDVLALLERQHRQPSVAVTHPR